MANQVRRSSQVLLDWLRAIAIAAITLAGLSAMNVRPAWFGVAIAGAAAMLALASPELAVLVAVTALTIPLIAAQPVLGLLALILAVVAVRYLGADGGRGYLVVGISAIGAFFGPVWAGVALAGCLFGAGEGALAAGVACVILEVLGVVLGRQVIGVTVIGGPPVPLAAFANMPASILSVAWVREAFASLDQGSVGRVVGGLSTVSQPMALVIQPLVWAAGAAAAGMVREQARQAKSLVLSVLAAAVGVVIPALGAALVFSIAALAVPWPGILTASAGSAAIAVVVIVLWEKVFRAEQKGPAPSARRVTMTSEDADVDELLRLIATAEDKLTSQHTTTKVVLITDMKSFSAMTEEDGSVATAKAIQRHRDLLIPIISSHGGNGKSTGGDGLVAAFETPAAALSAAAAMQKALHAHNEDHPAEREIWVRMGLAHGEVVLDNGGRPFIGAALNLAARVMNLADGGQVLATGDVAAAAKDAGLSSVSFGEFVLKNIHNLVEIVEILWEEDQQPHDPRTVVASEE